MLSQDLDFLCGVAKQLQTHAYFSSRNKTGWKRERHASVAVLFRLRGALDSAPAADQLSRALLTDREGALFDGKSPHTNITRAEDVLAHAHRLGVAQQLAVDVCFLRRTPSAADVNNGDLCFPGGHVDGCAENDFEAVLREVREEVGVGLTPCNSVYLGRAPKLFFARYSREKGVLYANAHLFLLFSGASETEFTLQESEICDAQWKSVSEYFLTLKPQCMVFKKKFENPIKRNMIPQQLQNFARRALEEFDYVESGALDIGMDEVLWGLTLNIIVYLLNVYGAVRKDAQCRALVQHAQQCRLAYKNDYRLPRVIDVIVRKMIQSNRARIIEYEAPRGSKLKRLYLVGAALAVVGGLIVITQY